VYDINSNEVVFCEESSCYKIEATEKGLKKKSNLVTNYNGKKQVIMPIDRS
jgi:hypothetical protein